MSKTEAYEEGRESDGGGNPYGGTPDEQRWDDYEAGKEDTARSEEEAEGTD